MQNNRTVHRDQLARLSRIEGQVRGIKRMIEEKRYCVDVLLQLKSAINALCKVRDGVFHHHLESCVHDSLAGDDRLDKERKIEEILELIDRFRKP
jgi:DNA-binding FrmR family transcriptional regulator